MRKYLFLLTSFLIITSQIKAQKTASVWTKKYEQGIYDIYKRATENNTKMC